MDKKLSAVLATRNEENNIARCINSFKEIADEIIIFDEFSSDKTVEIAKKLGARVYRVKHQDNFHITKQKAIKKAQFEWILQMDADEVITAKLREEIKNIISMSNQERIDYRWEVLSKNSIFKRHEQIIEKRDGRIGKNTNEIVAYFVPRVNIFLGKALIYGGVYPDPAIRLIKKGKAYLPAKSVHEIMEIDGEVGWTRNYMEHYDSPTLFRYVERLNRYTDLKSQDFKNSKTPKNFLFLILYSSFIPLFVFLKLYIRHMGLRDGFRGFLWAYFSASHYPVAYLKYYLK